MEQLIIYDPKDFPFGPLSNNFFSEMTIDGKKWKTVSNYIYSNMLITPSFKLAVKNADIKPRNKEEKNSEQIIVDLEKKQGKKFSETEKKNLILNIDREKAIENMDINSLFNYYISQEYIHTLRTAIEKSYTSKVSGEPELQKLLLDTEERPIIYVSKNNILGMGEDNKGMNLIGKILMQIRYNLRKDEMLKKRGEEKQVSEEIIFDTYKAMIILQKELRELHDIKIYVDKSPKDIVELYLKNHPEENFNTLGLSDHIKPTIVDMFKNGNLPLIQKELDNPGYMVLSGRRDNLRTIRDKLEIRRENTIFDSYVDYIVSKKYPKVDDETREKAVSTFKESAPSLEEYNKLRETVIEKYSKGELDPVLSDSILLKIKALKIPSKREIELAENMSLPPEDDETKNPLPQTSESSSDEENAIKTLLATDEKNLKNMLIKKLQGYTGKSYRKYRDLSVETLEKRLEKYEGKNPSKKVDENIGSWISTIKNKNNIQEVLLVSNIKPTKIELEKALKKYNKNNSTDFSISQVFIKFDTKQKPKVLTFDDNIDIRYFKPLGKPFQITPVEVEKDIQNPYRFFSPINGEKPFSVGGLQYPSVSIFITASLLTQAGVSRDISKSPVFSRGMDISTARSMLIQGNNFVSPDKANDIYFQKYRESFGELEGIYAKIALETKFKNVGLQKLLYLTGNVELVWGDKADIILGSGTEQAPGENKVGKILMEIRDKLPGLERVKIPADITSYLMDDTFMKKWLEMRLSDMCKVVYRTKQYLSLFGKQEEDIDSRFAGFVLNLIYYPCSTLILESQFNKIPVPEDFINLVQSCPGILRKLEKDYEKEMSDIKEEMERVKDNFWNLNTKKIAEEVQEKLSPEDIAMKVEIYKQTIPTPSEEDVEKYTQELIKVFEDTSKKPKENFDAKQRKEWTKFLKESLKPEKTSEETRKRMNRLLKKHEKQLAEREHEKNYEELKERLQKEREELYSQLTKGDKDRDKIIKEFIQKQEDERKRYYGLDIVPVKKSKEDIAKHEEIIKKYKEALLDLNRRKKDEITHLNFINTELSQIYWDRLVVMIQYLLKNIPDLTSESLKKAIIGSEMLNSRASKCQTQPDNMLGQRENCIASAISNIVSGLQKFKFQYAENIPFGVHDINYAVSVILGEKLETEGSDNIILIDDDVVPDVEEDKETDDDIETDGDDIGDDYGDEMSDIEDMGEDFAFMGMGRFKTRKETLRSILVDAVSEDVSDDIVDGFEKAIKKIENSKIPEKIKVNRINFFATLK
jgi:predicted NAD-dependent protein-ADP-ribosyltransferase YbiA (DUF1768 family)